MKKIFQKTAIAAALALPLLASAAAVPIIFDMNGSAAGQSVTVDLLDWLPGNALAIGGNPSTGLVAGTQTQLLYQANLGAVTLDGGPNLLGAGAQTFSAVAGFNEVVLTNTTGLNPTFGFADAPVRDGSNFFYMYANQFGSNLTGLGFASMPTGTLVMSGYISSVISSNFTSDGTFAPNLDNFGTNNYPGIGTLRGSGTSDINLTIDYANPDYFPNLLAGGSFAFSFFNTSQVVPFSQANPSACFSSDGVLGGLACDVPHNIGTVNGFTDVGGTTRNFQFQADGNQSFSRIPEPGSLALVGLALGVVGFVGRRSSKKS